VQVHPAKTDNIKAFPENLPQNPTVGQGQTLSTKIQYSKFRKVHKKVTKKYVNYDEVDKLIENSYYEDADKILKTAINSNSKNIKAKALWVVSLAKQYKLDPAQTQLNELLKKYPDNADLHYAQGIIYYKRTTSSNMEHIKNSQKLFEDSLKEFNKAIELDKKDARYYNAAGVVSLQLGKDADARKLFAKAVELNPKYSTAIDNMGTMDFVDGKLEDAEKKFNQALLHNTQNTTAMYHLAQVANQRQQYSNALTYLNNALAINPNSYAFQNLSGEIYAKQGNEAAAINAFRKAVMIKPEFAPAYFNLAEVYEKRGDGEFAIEQLKTALAIDPTFYDAKLKIADISLASGKYNQAIDNYSALAQIDDYKNDALKGLANAYFAKAQISSNKSVLGSSQELYKAFDELNNAIKANNDDLELHLAKLKLAKVINQPAMSQDELQNIINSNDTTLTAMVVKGEAYMTLNNSPEAKKMFDAAAACAKTLEDRQYLTEIFIYNKQYESAQAIIDNILKSDPQNTQALANSDYIKKCEKYSQNSLKSAQYFLKSKNYPTAQEYATRAIGLNPNNSQGYVILAEACEQQKDYNSAIANYKIYLNMTPTSADKNKIQNKIKYLENRFK
ncbi:MAG TPA: tetratricopeptide repeat protein, partial [Candidatus Gastranaerophilaceae bacterium]|nr:tetratricopeptide repeat protein [Candidatus Gastranaerophilaceae bacterium]